MAKGTFLSVTRARSTRFLQRTRVRLKENDSERSDKSGGQNSGVKTARADWLIAVCHSNLGDLFIPRTRGVGKAEVSYLARPWLAAESPILDAEDPTALLFASSVYRRCRRDSSSAFLSQSGRNQRVKGLDFSLYSPKCQYVRETLALVDENSSLSPEALWNLVTPEVCTQSS